MPDVSNMSHLGNSQIRQIFLDFHVTWAYICENYKMKQILPIRQMSTTREKIIRIALRKAMIKQSGYLYKDFGRPELVYQVVNEVRPGKKLRRRIARKLGRKLADVWPDSNIRPNTRNRNTASGP